MRLLLIGGSGLLGTELRKLNHEIIAPSRLELDVRVWLSVLHGIKKYAPDIVINAAAIKDNRSIATNPEMALETNIVGSAYIARACIEFNCRYVYISTDYVYKGDRGNYKETDEILPFNMYAWTKLGGECSARAVKNHLIIRTSFGETSFPYREAFIDKWSSKDYLDIIAPMILEASTSPLTGVLNIGTDRKTLFQYASLRNESVKPVRLNETSHSSPYDTSVNLQKWSDYKSEKPIAKTHDCCRSCGSGSLTKYLDLGLMPLANNLDVTPQGAREKERHPLQVMFCENCGLSQLSVVIDPGKMFSYYTYRSSINKGYVKHCKEMALAVLEKYQHPAKEFFHIDIAGNDGTLLKQFRDASAWKYKPLNIDPATNLCAIAEADGIQSIADFWSQETANRILFEHGEVDLITATNVFAHVDRINDFLTAAKTVLTLDGILIIECPYLVDFIDKFEFDTVYFEHLSYISILPVNELCQKVGLRIIEIEKFPIHGGTVRLTIAKDESSHVTNPSVIEFLQHEQSEGFTTLEKYLKWGKDVKTVIKYFGEKILNLKKEGAKIAAFAASAKGNTLLNAAGINTDVIDYICDETPEKIGKFSPGTGIPVVNKQKLETDPPEYLLILSWNFKDEIMEKVRPIFKGKFIIPIPNFEIVE